MIVARQFVVTGHVQGVYFRASTKQQAEAMGISGYARNLDNGGVEVLAVGSAEAVERLGNWLWKGSLNAQVADVAALAVALEILNPVPTAFSIR